MERMAAVSKPELVDVLEKMVRDTQYRAVVHSDPDTGLFRAALTPEERAALISWDPARLEALGIGAQLAHEAILGHEQHRRLEPSDAGEAFGPTGEL